LSPLFLPLPCPFSSLRQKSERCDPPISFWVRKNSGEALCNTSVLKFASLRTHLEPINKTTKTNLILILYPIYHLCPIVIPMMMISFLSQRVRLVGLVVVGITSRKPFPGLEKNTDNSR
jgi:hypothetical protein